VAVTALAAILVAVLILAVDVRTLVTILAASQAVDANPRAVVC
jgi:hypothetical protein